MPNAGDSQTSTGLEWFTRSAALASAKAALPGASAEARVRKAASALEVVDLALEPPEEFTHGDPNDAILLLLAEALRGALAVRAGEADGASVEDLLARVGEAELARCAPEGLTLAQAKELLGAGRARAFDGLTQAECDERLGLLRAFVRAVVAEVERPWATVRTLTRQRFTRTITSVVLTVALLGAGVVFGKRSLEGPELAAGKPFTASSAYDSFATAGKTNEPIAFDLFAHTVDEEHPWIRVDLGKPERVSKVYAKNRQDCCGERSIPLVLEASVDGEAWQEVARREEAFSEWTAQFTPTTARYLRFSVPRRTALHLSRVFVWR